MKLILKTLFVIILLTLTSANILIAQTPTLEPATEVRLGVRILDPFIKQIDNSYTGFSYELWQKLATDSNIKTTEVKVYPTVKELISAVEKKEVDVAISAVTITKEREEIVDFSEPMFNSGLNIMTNKKGTPLNFNSRLNNFKAFFNKKDFHIAYSLGALALLILSIIAFLYLKNKDNTTNHTNQLLLKSLIVILSAILLFQAVELATYVNKNQEINQIFDLTDKTVGTIKNSTSEQFLSDNRYTYKTYTTLDLAASDMENQDISAVVYDSPTLESYVINKGNNKFQITGTSFSKENFGIAFQNGSSLRSKINTALKKSKEDGSYKTLVEKYFKNIKVD
jgi:polar amino acid transport system substrate-binding protein